MNIKKILLICLVLLGQNLIASPFKISLKEICKNNECKPRIWYIKDDFKQDYFNPEFQPDSTWKKIDHFPIWVNKYFQLKTNLHHFTFYTEFDSPEDFKISRQTGIRFGEIGEVFEIYLNGKLIANDGSIKNNKVNYHRTIRGQVFEFDKEIIKPKSNQLVIKISGDPKYDHTGFYLTNGYDIGYLEELQYEVQDRISLILIGIYVMVGFYHLFLFIKRRKEITNLYYSFFTIGLGIYLYTRSSAIFENHWDTGIIQKVELSILYPMVCSMFLLIEELFFQKTRKFTFYFTAFNIVLSLLTILVPLYFAEYILRVWQISIISLGLPLVLFNLYLAIKNKVQNAKRLSFGIIIIVLSALYDVLDSLLFNSGFSFTKYTFFFFVFGFATVLANKFIEVHNQIEELNENLENKVNERTKELSESLVKVNELKKQQDGDYYLTSLLIQPLGINNSISNTVRTDFYIEQKKRFHFKGNDAEIGGDLCRTETIQLKGRPYTVFFNSDAMGKSIQGAGGAIVMGAVFDSIVERTQLSKAAQDIFPERWLKNSFVELHKVFESFDCSMLVSVVIGLIDDSTGLMYFINAEHPNPVLYRDGKASFIPVQNLYRKLGMPITDSDSVNIETFQIKFGDIIILGSDGRDDLMIETLEGSKELNIDEKLFLKFVEEGRGQIDDIARVIKETTELTDDLTFLSIYLKMEVVKFRTNSLEEILLLEEPNKELTNEENLKLRREKFILSSEINFYELKQFLLAYHKLKNFETVARLGREYIHYLPIDHYSIFLISNALRELKLYPEAIELGERLKIRGKCEELNLINLAECHFQMGNSDRARYLLSNFLKKYPETKDSNLLRQKLGV